MLNEIYHLFSKIGSSICCPKRSLIAILTQNAMIQLVIVKVMSENCLIDTKFEA